MKNYKNIFLLISFCFFSFPAYSQNIFSGRVLDIQTKEPVPGASIMLVNGPATGTATDNEGNFTITLSDGPNQIKISSIGYVTQIISISKSIEKIMLEPDLVNLQTVVVSGSRELQQRSDIPVAISKISPQLIEDTKATALYQVLNKVSGVYMVNLGNEQHTMAIRQPITYNALYLYMEDGIPIRPVGIFNHNSLYEINMAGMQNIEVIKGTSSSLYGSNAIGGAINFITNKAGQSPMLKINLQSDNYGYKRTDLSVGNTFGKFGIYAGGYVANQKNGWQDYTDMDKTSFNVRGDYKITEKTKFTLSATYNYLFTQTPGALDSTRFYNRSYTSNQRFTYRKVNAFRTSAKVEHQWGQYQSTSFTLFYRNNETGQLPSYALTYAPQVNDQTFQSYGLLAQHKIDFKFLESKLILGAYIDNSPNKYWVKALKVNRDAVKNYYTGYTNTDSLTDNYKLNLINYAFYGQYEMQISARLRMVAGLRYDYLQYNFKNQLPSNKTKLKQQQTDAYNIIAPKLGTTFSLGPNKGLYANFSTGFQPPETSSLYSSTQKEPLKSAKFYNYEAGGWLALNDRKIYLDFSLFDLEGRDEILNVLMPDFTYQNKNVGATRHQGIEYTVTYSPISDISFRFSGTNARHIFIDYNEYNKSGNEINKTSFAGKIMNNAPKWIVNSEIFYKPHFIQGSRIGIEWQHVDKYFTNNANTKTYSGYDIFNLRMGYKLPGSFIKGFEVWGNILNLSDQIYATTVTPYQYGDTYTAAPPRMVSVGIGYNLK